MTSTAEASLLPKSRGGNEDNEMVGVDQINRVVVLGWQDLLCLQYRDLALCAVSVRKENYG